MAVPADLLSKEATFVDGRGLRDAVASGAAEALLDAVLAQQCAEFGAQVAAVLGVHQGMSFALAASSMSSRSSTWSASTPWPRRSSIARSAIP